MYAPFLQHCCLRFLALLTAIALWGCAVLPDEEEGQEVTWRTADGLTCTAFVATQDATIKSSAPTVAFGATDPSNLVVWNIPGANTLVQFDLSSIPATSGVVSADLKLRKNNGSGVSGSDVINIVTGPWAESTVTWNTRPGIGAAIGSLTIPAVNGQDATASLASTAQGWVNGVNANYGVRIVPASVPASFNSKEQASNKPTLTVCYNAPTCSDGIQNQGETDIDCGGPCAACPTCSDLIQNGAETDVDCGGGVCTACDEGGTCVVDADCLTSSCSAGVCAWPVCDGSSDCDACTQCAIVGVASADYNALTSSIPGQDYANCIGACLDTACWQVCETTYPSGAVVYNAAVTSIYCVGCPLDCDMANNQFWDCSSGGPVY